MVCKACGFYKGQNVVDQSRQHGRLQKRAEEKHRRLHEDAEHEHQEAQEEQSDNGAEKKPE